MKKKNLKIKIKADYHFHPNLPLSDRKAIMKSIKWWEYIKNVGENCIIISEHVYKNPQRSFEIMSENCPSGILCFPGVEYVTKEGIDIVVFSNSEKIYKNVKLITPFSMNYNELMEMVKKDNILHAFVTHPFTLGKTSIIKILGMNAYYKYVNEIGAVECSNGSSDGLIQILKLVPIKIFAGKKLDWAKKTQKLPKKYYPNKIKFLAVGSDAHIFENIGNHVELFTDNFNKNAVFKQLITNKNDNAISTQRPSAILDLLKNLSIVLNEFLIKKKLRICEIFSLKQSC